MELLAREKVGTSAGEHSKRKHVSGPTKDRNISFHLCVWNDGATLYWSLGFVVMDTWGIWRDLFSEHVGT